MANEFVASPYANHPKDPFEEDEKGEQNALLTSEWMGIAKKPPPQKLKRLIPEEQSTPLDPQPAAPLRRLAPPPQPEPAVAAIPPSKQEMLAQSFQQWQRHKSPESMSEVLKAMDPLIRRSISGWADGSKDPNLYGRAKILAIEALKTYDPDKGALSTHLVNALQGVKRLRRKQQNVIHIPERLSQDYGAMREALAVLSDELGREPNDQELADYTGFSPKRLAEIRRNRMPTNSGSLAARMEAAHTDANFAVQDPARDALVWQSVYDEASDVDKKILEWSLGLNAQEKMPNQVIAQKLQVSPGLISQRKLKLQNKYDELHSLLWK